MKKDKNTEILAKITNARLDFKIASEKLMAVFGAIKEMVGLLNELVDNTKKAKTKKPETKAAAPKQKRKRTAKSALPAAPKKKRTRRAKPKDEKPAEEPAEEQANTAPSVRRRTPGSVRLTPREITLNIGGSPVKALAERDATEFLNNPMVFWNRPTQFPDPKRYGVQPRVEGARVIERTDPKFTRAPWTVSLTIHIEGDVKKAEAWGLGVYTKNKSDQE